MTIGDWLDTRTPPPPPALRARLNAVLADDLAHDAERVAAVCIDAAEALLRDLVGRESAGRDSALDLLAADALATYAFEAAAERPEFMSARADEAMSRFASAVANAG